MKVQNLMEMMPIQNGLNVIFILVDKKIMRMAWNCIFILEHVHDTQWQRLYRAHMIMDKKI